MTQEEFVERDIEVSDVDTAIVEAAPRSFPIEKFSEIGALVSQAIDKGTDGHSLEKLLDQYERMDKFKAVKAYNVAVAAFRAACPPIERTKENEQFKVGKPTKEGIVKVRKYYDIDSVLDVVVPVAAEFGISIGFPDYIMADGCIARICVLSHVDGHSEPFKGAPIPLASPAGCSPQQKALSADTYAKKSALVAATAVRGCDEDDDGGNLPIEAFQKITPEQVHDIEDAMIEIGTGGTGYWQKRFLEFMGVAKIADIKTGDLGMAWDQLNKGLAKKREAKP